MTCSPVGGLPLGYLIVSSEKETVLTEAFNLYKSLLPTYAFKGRGPDKGPQIILTDDADSEINALRYINSPKKTLLYKSLKIIQDSLARCTPPLVYFSCPPSCLEVRIFKFNEKF